jgi:hypothetical protein
MQSAERAASTIVCEKCMQTVQAIVDFSVSAKPFSYNTTGAAVALA